MWLGCSGWSWWLGWVAKLVAGALGEGQQGAGCTLQCRNTQHSQMIRYRCRWVHSDCSARSCWCMCTRPTWLGLLLACPVYSLGMLALLPASPT